VGFYSAFMVADRVEATSRRAGADEAWTWASEGQGEYTLAPATRAEAGTDVVLHLKADAEEFLEPFRLQAVVRKWADHITVPIAIARDGKDEPANEGTALWRKPKSEVGQESYTEFYRHLGHLFDEPWATLHWRARARWTSRRCCSSPAASPSRRSRASARAGCACTCGACSSPTRPAAAALAALRGGRGGHRGPAAERLARDAAVHPGAGPHPPRGDRTACCPS
jgi:HSP90 family molecular chaperone